MTLVPFQGEYCDSRGRTPVSPLIFKQPHTLILGVSGQSMLANYAQITPYNPWTGGVFEFDVQSGNIYQITDGTFPTMGMDGWWAGQVPGPIRLSVLPYWADLLVALGKARRVLLCAHCMGGTTAERWCPIGDMYQRSAGTVQMLQGLGLAPNYWIEMQGQSDLNTADPTCTGSGYNWIALRQWRWAALRSIGMNATIVSGMGAHWTGYSDVNPSRYDMIKQAQRSVYVSLQNGQPLQGIALGPDDDEWSDAYRVDGVHPADGMRYWQLQRWLPAFPVF